MKKPNKQYTPAYAKRLQRAALIEKLTGVKLTRAQVRGHARVDEPTVSKLKRAGALPTNTANTLKKYAAVIKRLASGESLTAATRAEKTTPKTIKRMGTHRDDITGTTLKYRAFKVYTSGGITHEAVQVDKRTASIIGRYLNLVGASHKTIGKRRELAKFTPKTITDVFGNKYTLATKYETLVLMGVLDEYDEQSENKRDTPEVVYRTEKAA